MYNMDNMDSNVFFKMFVKNCFSGVNILLIKMCFPL